MSDKVEETLPDIQLAQSIVIHVAINADRVAKCGGTCRYLKREQKFCALFDCTLMRPGHRCQWCLDEFIPSEVGD